MKNNFSNILMLFLAVIMVALQSCAPAREMAYVADAERDSAQKIVVSYANSIHPGDQLYIYVHSLTPESVIPFNQETQKVAVERSHLNVVVGQNGENVVPEAYKGTVAQQIQGYLVDDEGMIVFPMLGRIHAAGLTHDSLQVLIQQRLIAGDYLYDPVVTVSSMNFRVSVVGEVARPNELHITGDRLTLFEALAMCGDITDYGQRENVVVLREKNGKAVPIVVDMTKKSLFDSECYYLQHNDIVYVEPNKKKKREADYNEHLPQNLASYVRLATAIGLITRTTVMRLRIASGIF